MIYASLKRFFRENRVTRVPYYWLALSAHEARFWSNRVRFGQAFPIGYFDDLFARGADPWLYEGDDVSERRKELILGYLPAEPPPRLLEIGCASGWITQELATRAGMVFAVDCSAVALDLARERCRGNTNVEFAEADLQTDPLPGDFDFTMCAGVLNFFSHSIQPAIRDKLIATLRPGGLLLIEHLIERMPGSEVTGDDIHSLYLNSPMLKVRDKVQRDGYEVVLLEKT